MAKGIYVGVDSKARKVKKAYVGVDNKARKVKKGYIGVGGVAQLFYSSVEIIQFNSNPAPTTGWTATSTDNKNFSSQNKYGIWNINGTQAFTNTSADWYVNNAFDANIDTQYRSVRFSDSSTYMKATLNCPTNVYIRPSKISITHHNTGDGSTIEGYNINTNAWEKLINISGSKSNKTEILELSLPEDAYYNAIRISLNYYSSTYSIVYLHEFAITEGTIKIE
jgi:hypothetical protein